MSVTPIRTDGSLEAQPRMGAPSLHNLIYCPGWRSAEILHAQAAALDDVLEGTERDGFAAVHGDGSNHRSRASFALRMASSSVSPADAQPGSSGKNAAHLLVSGSCSTTNRSFMTERIILTGPPRNPAL